VVTRKAEALPAGAVADLLPIAWRDLAIEPGLDELAGRGDEARQQHIVGVRKSVLSGLQPGLDIGQRREIAKRHCWSFP